MRYYLLILTLFCGICHAQEKSKKHTCRIVFLDRPANAPSTLYLFDGQVSQKVELPGMNFSPVYELPAGPLTLTFLTEPAKKPDELPLGAPSVKVPETTLDLYVIVVSDPTNKVAPVRAQVIDAGAEKLKKGQTMWFNFSDLLIGGKLGSESLMIKPKGSVVMEPPRNEAGDYPVSLAYRKSGSDEQFPICETRWLYDPRSRLIGFIIPEDGILAPRVLLFPDFRSEPAKRQADVPVQ